MSSDDSTLTVRIASAAVGAVINTVATMPLDVLKTRVQSQLRIGHRYSAHANIPITCICGLHSSSTNAANGTLSELGKIPFALNYARGAIPPWPNQLDQYTGSLMPCTPSHLPNRMEACGGPQARRATEPAQSLRLWNILVNISRESGISSLWRGLSPSLAMVVPSTCLYFTTYEILRLKLFPDYALTPLFAGCAARFLVATASSPLELIKTRLQSIEQHELSPRESFKQVIKETIQDIRVTGLHSLWLGIGVTLLRDLPFSGVYWLGYETLRNELSSLVASQTSARNESPISSENRSSTNDNSWTSVVDSPVGSNYRNRLNNDNQVMSERINEPRRLRMADQYAGLPFWTRLGINFASGALSGTVATVLTQPLDVVKTILQTGRPSYTTTSTTTTLVALYKGYGFSGLFRGLVPRCVKVAPSCAIMISSYEAGKMLLQL